MTASDETHWLAVHNLLILGHLGYNTNHNRGRPSNIFPDSNQAHTSPTQRQLPKSLPIGVSKERDNGKFGEEVRLHTDNVQTSLLYEQWNCQLGDLRCSLSHSLEGNLASGQHGLALQRRMYWEWRGGHLAYKYAITSQGNHMVNQQIRLRIGDGGSKTHILLEGGIEVRGRENSSTGHDF